MRVVADTLKDLALLPTNGADAALYAKSSYNRYYYACFYMTIQHLHSIVNTNFDIEHKALGKTIKGSFKCSLRSKINEAPIPQKSLFQDILEASTNRWVQIVSSLQDARHAADYDRDARVEMSSDDFTLSFRKKSSKEKKITVSEAASQIKELQEVFDSLAEIYKQVGVSWP